METAMNKNGHAVEQAVLGCLLCNNTTYDEIAAVLKATDFYDPWHREVFTAIQVLMTQGKQADVISVSDFLSAQRKGKGVDPAVPLYEILAGECMPTAIKTYVDILKKNSITREVIAATYDILTHAKEGDENILDYAQQKFLKIDGGLPNTTKHVSEILPKVANSIDERSNNTSCLLGLSTGFAELDRVTHGLRAGELIIVAARPGMGKTLLAMNIAEHVLTDPEKTVAIFSLEMSDEQLVERLLVSHADLNATCMQTGQLVEGDFSRIANTIAELSSAPLYINDHSVMTVRDILTQSRKLQRSHGLSLVIIDYLTLMTGEGENETIKIGNMTRQLKILARELRVPIIVISQLNRSLEQRQDKRPVMADLRQSGAIEQDADLILFIYRDEVYNKHSPQKGVAEIIIGKHRNGPLDTILLGFNGNCCRFENNVPKHAVTTKANVSQVVDAGYHY